MKTKRSIIIENFVDTKLPTGLGNFQIHLTELLKKNNEIYLITQKKFPKHINYIKIFLNKYFFLDKNSFKSKDGFLNYLNIPYLNILDKIISIFFFNTLKIYTDGIDFVHSGYLSSISYPNSKKIITIHDTIPFDFPNYANYSRLKLYFLKKYHISSIKNCDLIFTVSNYSKKRIIKIFDTRPEKIFVTYQSANKFPIFSKEEEGKILLQYSLIKGNYYLYYGAFEPKKNIEYIIDGFLSSNSNHKLVLIFTKGWKNKRIFKKLSQIQESDRKKIILIHHMVRKQLGIIIKNTRSLIFPSLIEGFGLPIIETLQFKRPVIISDIEIFKELFKQEAIFVNNKNYFSLSKKINYLDNINNYKFELNKIKNYKKFNDNFYLDKLNEGYDYCKNLIK